MSRTDWKLRKRPTGIAGLDQATHGGLPAHQTTLLLGYSGTGKTILALQILANAVEQGSGGVLVSFEESPAQLKRDADSFQWGAALNESKNWAVIDARLPVGAQSAGGFDIDALLGAVELKSKGIDEPWVILDGIDQLMQYQSDRALAVNQLRKLDERCERLGWTILLTGKVSDNTTTPQYMEGLEFLLCSTLLLTSSVVDRRLVRRLRIAKYRGSAHVADEMPLIINERGIILPYQAVAPATSDKATSERLSTGIERLDQVLGGGIYRGSSILISGRPGTAKSTLAASFAEAAAKRGERTLYVSFDEVEKPYVRNLRSVSINLQDPIDQGLIRFDARSAWAALVSEHLLAIQTLIDSFEPHCLVIDPISALLKSEEAEASRFATEWLLDVARSRNITTALTSLTAQGDREGESSLASASTVADTWIVLDYNVRGGERNRSLSVVKSRGTSHSNQQRELILSDNGLDLADIYEYGSEVLMGTARAEMETKMRAQARREELEATQRRQTIERKIEQARSELDRFQAELDLMDTETAEERELSRRHVQAIRRRREPGSNEHGGGEQS